MVLFASKRDASKAVFASLAYVAIFEIRAEPCANAEIHIEAPVRNAFVAHFGLFEGINVVAVFDFVDGFV